MADKKLSVDINILFEKAVKSISKKAAGTSSKMPAKTKVKRTRRTPEE